MKKSEYPGSCVSSEGRFLVGIHKPSFHVDLLRKNDFVEPLGSLEDGTVVTNEVNFPLSPVNEPHADIVYEIPNPFPFRGTTYINSAWADAGAEAPESISLPKPPDVSMRRVLEQWKKTSRALTTTADSYPSSVSNFSNSPATPHAKTSFTSGEDVNDDAHSASGSGVINQPNSDALADYLKFVALLPRPMLLALAESSTDSLELVTIAKTCCTFQYSTSDSDSDDHSHNRSDSAHIDEDQGNVELYTPCGLRFKKNRRGVAVPEITDHDLFEILANNPHLPDVYKRVMVLKPGIQGMSEITGEWQKSMAPQVPQDDAGTAVSDGQAQQSHVFEYVRRNSYIPWGHFAANTADDTVRYKINDLTPQDMTGMRYLYYQRTYLRLFDELKQIGRTDRVYGGNEFKSIESGGKRLSEDDLETLRGHIIKCLTGDNPPSLQFNGALWGWNFGFGYAQSGYRLHASHQQIHQQYAMIPAKVTKTTIRVGEVETKDAVVSNQRGAEAVMPSYACGDMVADFVHSYRTQTGKNFFDCYCKAIRSNRRVDGTAGRPSSLIIFEDDQVMLFVPKAQTSQWELQLMPTKPCGNVLEAGAAMRASLDRGILTALQILERMGARMVTSIEYSKRFDSKSSDQRLLYAFLPKIPQSPGAFSEAQLRWINGHYPEDFAAACRAQLG